jgi:membrane fusion protein (multidrug efflux system)
MQLFDQLKALKPLRWKAGLFVLFTVLWVSACGQGAPSQSPGQRPLPAVTTVLVQMRDVDVVRDYPARIYGARQVQVRARVQGILQAKRYVEGQRVDQDEVLFSIDPEPYQIAVRRAEAERSDARASRDHAMREWKRVSQLYAHNAVSERDRDQALTNFELAKARLGMADAALDDARRNLSYTEVRSPVAGVTGIEDVSEGNLIDWGGLLTTITQNDPVHVRFSLPESDAMTQRRAGGAMRDQHADPLRSQAEVILPDGRPFAHKGTIDFTAHTIDPRTGTVSARAEFPNPDHALVPGQFVRIRVLLQNLAEVMLVPEEAVSQGPEGPRVFVVDQDKVVAGRAVRLGPVVDGEQVIFDGLNPGDQVVVIGHVALRDGMTVAVRNAGRTGEAL